MKSELSPSSELSSKWQSTSIQGLHKPRLLNTHFPMLEIAATAGPKYQFTAGGKHAKEINSHSPIQAGKAGFFLRWKVLPKVHRPGYN